MSNYTMPVLSEQEKQSLISFCESEMPYWSPDGDFYPLFGIALAALTAEPVAFCSQRGLDVRDKITAFTCPESAEAYAKTAGWIEITPLYTGPAALVIKQEGEQRD